MHPSSQILNDTLPHAHNQESARETIAVVSKHSPSRCALAEQVRQDVIRTWWMFICESTRCQTKKVREKGQTDQTCAKVRHKTIENATKQRSQPIHRQRSVPCHKMNFHRCLQRIISKENIDHVSVNFHKQQGSPLSVHSTQSSKQMPRAAAPTYRRRVDVRLEGIVRVGQRGQSKRHDVSVGVWGGRDKRVAGGKGPGSGGNREDGRCERKCDGRWCGAEDRGNAEAAQRAVMSVRSANRRCVARGVYASIGVSCTRTPGRDP